MNILLINLGTTSNWYPCELVHRLQLSNRSSVQHPSPSQVTIARKLLRGLNQKDRLDKNAFSLSQEQLSDALDGHEIARFERMLAAADPNYYGCFAVVKNGNGKLVGQTVGSCAKISTKGTAKVAAGTTGKLCVPKTQTRKVFASYTVAAFADSGTYKLSTKATGVTDDGIFE